MVDGTAIKEGTGLRDVIQKVLATEAEARLMVEAAKAEAEKILADAQARGQEVLERARQEARTEAETILEAAVRTAEQEKQARLAGVAAEINAQLQLDQTSRQGAIDGVVACVCGLKQ